MALVDSLRRRLRSFRLWVEFQEINREGWIPAFRRRHIQRKILKTKPIKTAKCGPVEIRILTWRRDWLNAIWTLKSFYLFSQTDYPLFIHDGGLKSKEISLLRSHFPDAIFITNAKADEAVQQFLHKSRLEKCIAYRNKSVLAKRIFDFFILSKADFILSFDSDTIFFQRPKELLKKPSEITKNIYLEDMKYAYRMSLENLEKSFGVKPVPLINCGIFLVRKKTVDFERINEWLTNDIISGEGWLTEQTIHALISAVSGCELLPKSYLTSTEAGLGRDLVCKHYPGFFRQLLYREGMAHLINKGFLKFLNY